jgi:hypothetical protein
MNWLPVILCILSCIFALWAFAGLFTPKDFFSFALPMFRTRGNAFCFPLRFAAICAIAATGSVYGAHDDGIAIWAGLISGLMFWRACLRFSRLRGTSLQRMGIVLPSESHYPVNQH